MTGDNDPGRYSMNRLFEWSATCVLLVAGALVLVTDGGAHDGVLMVVRKAGVQEFWVASFCLVFGLLRATALLINGRSLVYGPMLRSVGAMAGALLWSQFLLALLWSWWIRDDVFVFAISMNAVFAVAELRAAYRASRDGHTVRIDIEKVLAKLKKSSETNASGSSNVICPGPTTHYPDGVRDTGAGLRSVSHVVRRSPRKTRGRGS